MYSQRVTVRYTDGTEKGTTLTQWSMGQFGQWAARQGFAVDVEDPGLMGVVMLRYQAYCEIHRDGNARPSWDKWDALVSEVEPQEDPAESDPTEPIQSVG